MNGEGVSNMVCRVGVDVLSHARAIGAEIMINPDPKNSLL